VESVLREGESLSGFVEESIRRQIEHRKFQQSFLERGLASRDAARASGEYASKDEVMDSLHSMLEAAQGRK
jgi:predicted transcriptional regulator